MRVVMWIVGAALLALILMFGLGAYLKANPKVEARQAESGAIRECRKLAREALDPPNMVAACDKMEAEYVAKWGRAP